MYLVGVMNAFGIEIPAALVNNNCVQDACARLREALKLSGGRETSYVTKARDDLKSWLR